ncbi:lysostaphin resistance A-like protein [Amnibacterium sp.]|uniref:CPBP family intramembrane glutamic endopeptidase n=1 Tax=Amnibacterium sp. TaxID=1872496 RepID=UPI003F7C1275
MNARLRAHPVWTVLGLETAHWMVVIGGSLLLAIALPGLPGYSTTGPSRSLLLVLVSCGLILALIAALRWWRLAAFTPVRAWRDLRLYWLPAVLLVVPLVAGVRQLAPGALAVLAVGYIATGVYEEALWRGVMVGLLGRIGIWPAVLLSSVLFGLGHLGNGALRGMSALIVLQAFGSAVQGVGLAALRLRTDTIWPLMGFHALHDFSLQLGTLPIAAIEAPIDTVLLIYGIVLLRRSRRSAVITG